MPAHVTFSETQSGPLRTLDSAELFEGTEEVMIVHKGVAYRLRITRQDKLILTK